MERSDCCRRARAGAAQQYRAVGGGSPRPEEGPLLSERSERVGRPSDAPPTPVWRLTPPRSEPQLSARRTRRPRSASSGERPIRLLPIRPAADPPFGALRGEPVRPRPRLGVGSSAENVVGEPVRLRLYPDLRQIRGAPLLAGRGRRVLRRGASGSLRGHACSERGDGGAPLPVAHGAPLLRRCAQQLPLLRTWNPPPTARYCCAAPALARRQQSLRSWWQPLRSFLAARQGSLTIS